MKTEWKWHPPWIYWFLAQTGEGPDCSWCAGEPVFRTRHHATGWLSYRLDTADFLDTGTIEAVLMLVETVSCDSDMFQMSVKTSTNWLAHVLDSRGCYQAQQLYSYWLWTEFFWHPLRILRVEAILEAEWTLQVSLCWCDQSEHKKS